MPRTSYIACYDCQGPVNTTTGLNHRGIPCEHRFTFRRNTESTTVYFRGPNGEISIPWEPDSPCPPGYTREEAKGAHAVRKLERELDAKDLAKYRSHQAKLAYVKAPGMAKRRADLQQIVNQGVTTTIDRNGNTRTIHVSPFGREIARQAIAKMDRGYSTNFDPGNHRD